MPAVMSSDDVREAAAEAVAEHECRDDEADGEHDAEGGEGETNLVRPEVPDGEGEHVRVPICVSSRIQWVEPAHVVEHGIRGRVGELVGHPTVGEEHHAVE